MRLEHLTLRGFMTAFAGKQVAVDFAQLPDGLIAIVGDNGAGKSTLLEAAAAGVYREPMSRKGALESYAMDRDSFIEARWAIGGQTFTTRLSIDGIKGGSAAAIRREGQAKPLNDGKVSTYDPVIADLFPPVHVFKASAFAAQNKAGSFVRASKADRRDIMNAALNLDRLVEMGQTAKLAAAEVEKVRVRLQAELEALDRDTAPGVVGELQRRRAALQQAAVDAAARREALQVEIAGVEQQLALLADQVAAHAAAAQRVDHAAAVLAARQQDLQVHVEAEATAGAGESRELNQLTIDYHRKVDALTGRSIAAQASDAAELQVIADDLAAKRADIEKRLKGNEDLQAMSAEIAAAVAAVKELTPRLDTLRAQVDQQAADERRLGEALAVAEKALSAFTQPQADLDRAKGDAALLADVPCGGRGDFAACQLLVNATTAKRRIAELEAQLAGVTAAVVERDRLAEAKRQAHASWTTAKANADGVAAALQAAEPKAKYAEPLAAYTARVEELQRQRAGAEQDAATRTAAAQARHAAAAQRLADERADLDRALDAATTALQARVDARVAAAGERQAVLTAAVVEAQDAHLAAVAALEQLQAGHHQASSLQARLEALRADRDGAVTAVATAEADAAAIDRRRQDVEVKAAQAAFVRARLGRLDTELLEWQRLQQALDRDGLPALETDQAGPEIAATTNLILQDCFESRFSVELVTQVARASGKGTKDEITLLVTDNHTGDVRDISDLSGGEEVIVAEAFMNAVAIFVNARSASPVQTFFRDETTGALTKENTQRYVRMLRKVQAIAGVRQIVFISHDPEACALADVQLRVADGTVTVVRPPFQEAA